MKLQFQVAVISLGVEGPTYLQKYPGRYLSLHLADDGPTEQQAVGGRGSVDCKGLFAAASHQYLHAL